MKLYAERKFLLQRKTVMIMKLDLDIGYYDNGDYSDKRLLYWCEC
jgi:hypothetical protein